MLESNLLKIGEYLSSLECPVCHRCISVEVREVSPCNYLLFVSGDKCCQQHRDYLCGVLRKELTSAENLGISYEPGRV